MILLQTLSNLITVVVVQLLSCAWFFATPWTPLSFTVSWNSHKLISIEWMMPSNHLILGHPLFLLPSVFPSIKVFFNELVLCIRWPKYWSFSFSIRPSDEHPGLISFMMDWFDFLCCPRDSQESSPLGRSLLTLFSRFQDER